MHAIQGGWVGQTFALAKHNEYEGKKTRIRRSKEERKEMVESFIRKYQKLNNGNFPSLNLTHKEVGGSFYTVREIVRDIIQGNRVLGPAKFSPEEQSSDQFLEQDPLGSIAIGLKTLNEKHLEHHNVQDAIEETLVSSGLYTRTEHQMVDNGLVINGSQVDERTNKSTEASVPQLQIGELLAPEQIMEPELTTPIANTSSATPAPTQIIGREHQMVENGLFINGSQVDGRTNKSTEASAPQLQIGELLAPKQIMEQELTTPIANETPATPAPTQITGQELTTPIAQITPATADVIVETFPLRPVTRTNNRVGDDSEELKDLNNNAELEMPMLELEQGKERPELNGGESMKNSNSVYEKFEDDSGTGNIIISGNSSFGEVKEEKNLGDTLVAILKQTSHEEFVGHAIEGHTEPQDRAPHQSVIAATNIEQSQIVAGSERASVVQSGFDAKNLTNNHAKESKTTEKGLENVNKHSSNGQLGGCSQRRSNPTLDRINLESWDGVPKNSVKQAANPFVAIFRAFVDAFVKFWSE